MLSKTISVQDAQSKFEEALQKLRAAIDRTGKRNGTTSDIRLVDEERTSRRLADIRDSTSDVSTAEMPPGLQRAGGYSD